MRRIELQSKGYVEIMPDGTVLAGYTKDDATIWATAQEAYDFFRNIHAANSRDHAAWNIAYELADYV